VSLVAMDGRSLLLRYDPERGGSTAYTATVSIPAGQATIAVHGLRSNFAKFVRGLADDWRGFTGTRRWSSEDQWSLGPPASTQRASCPCVITMAPVLWFVT